MAVGNLESRIAGAVSIDALWTALRLHFDGSAVTRIVYLHLPPLGAPDSQAPEIRVAGIPPDLAARYLEERLYRDNPISQAAQRRVEPVYWDEIDEAALSEREQDFITEFRATGLRDGVSLPLYGPDGRRGQGGLGFREGVRRLPPETLRQYWQIFELAHLRFCALLLPTLGPMPRLSRREAEVLGWVARGKSNALIGQILGISGATVDAHLRRIYLKLGVFDRITAAVRGIGIGLIHADL